MTSEWGGPEGREEGVSTHAPRMETNSTEIGQQAAKLQAV